MPKIIRRYASISSNESTGQTNLDDNFSDQISNLDLNINESSKDYVFQIISNEIVKAAILKREQFGNKFVEDFRNLSKYTTDSTNCIDFSPKQWYTDLIF